MKYRILAKTTLALAAAALLAACGGEDLECGDGTVDQNGQCVPAEEVEDICAEGTTVEDGRCVPDDSVCTGPTSLEDGQCVIQASACNAGTELDPNENICVISDETCSGDTALQVDDDGNTRCVPTDQVCDEGTTFDADTRLCLPDATCQEGDVIVDGVCVSPAEELAGQADIEETENNDPATGGEAQDLGLADADGEVVFTGTIDAPSEDGVQDVDVFSFEAEAGDWFQLSVQSTGLPTPGFVVEGPAGFLRESYAGGADATARTVVAPENGEYTVTVLPAQLLPSQDGSGPYGDEDWSYVGTAEAIDSPDATDVDLSSGTATVNGSLADLQDNLVELSGVESDAVLLLSVESLGADADALFQTWDDTPMMRSSQQLGLKNQYVVDASEAGALQLLFDWRSADGASLDYNVEIAEIGANDAPTLAAEASETVEVSATRFDTLTISQTNGEDADLDVVVTDEEDREIYESSSIENGEQLRVTAPRTGTYTVEFTNATEGELDPQLSVYAQPPTDLGSLEPGDEVTTGGQNLVDDEVYFYTFEMGAGEVLELGQQNMAQSASFAHRLYDPSGARHTDTGSLPSMNLPTPAEYVSHYAPDGGRFLLRVVAGTDLPDTRVKAMVSEPTELDSPTAGNPVSTAPTAYTNDQARYYSVDVTEGQLLSLEHDNLNTRPMELYIHDAATGELVYEESSFWPQSNDSASTARLRAAQDGTYIIKLVADGETMDEDVLTLETFTPDIDLGTVDADNPVTHSLSNDLMEDEVITATFDTVAGQKVTIAHDNAESEEMGVIVRGPDGSTQLDTSFQDALSDSSADRPFVVSSGGTYLIIADATEDLTDISLELEAEEAEALGTLPTDGTAVTTSPIVLNEDAFTYYSFEIPAGHGVRISHDNDQQNDTDFILYGSDGAMLLEEDAPATSEGGTFGWEPEDYINSMTETGGMRYLSAENGAFSNSTTQTITLEAVEPVDLGTASDGELVYTNDGTYLEGEIVFYRVTFDEPVILSGGMLDEYDDMTLYDSEGQELESEFSGEFEDYSVPAGSYYFGYEVGGEYDSHTLEFTLRPGFTLP